MIKKFGKNLTLAIRCVLWKRKRKFIMKKTRTIKMVMVMMMMLVLLLALFLVNLQRRKLLLRRIDKGLR